MASAFQGLLGFGALGVFVVACGGSASSRCGAGTTLTRDGVCVADVDAAPSVVCGPGTAEKAGRCVVLPNDADGPQLPGDGGFPEASTQMDVTPPSFGGPLLAQTSTDEAVIVSWSPAVDDVTPSSRIVYEVAWGTHPGFAPDWSKATKSNPGARNVIVTGLPAPQAAFVFRARAIDEAGNADNNHREIGGTTGVDQTPPDFAGCRAVSGVSFESVTVEWDPASDRGTPSSDIIYEVWIRPAGSSGDIRQSGTLTTVVGGLKTTLNGLDEGTDYEIFCDAKDAEGNLELIEPLLQVTTKADDLPPTFNGVVSATPGSAPHSVDLTWSSATDNASPDSAIVYLVYGTDVPGQEQFDAPPVLVTTGGATSATITDQSSRVTHYFAVRARDHAGNVDGNKAEVSTKVPTSFSLDVQPVFTATCALLTCHTTGADGQNPPIQGLDMDEGAAYSNIVNVVAREGINIGEPNLKRVDATSTNPMDSYLWRKIQNPALSNVFGVTMPPPADHISFSADQAKIITDWITEGSHDN